MALLPVIPERFVVLDPQQPDKPISSFHKLPNPNPIQSIYLTGKLLTKLDLTREMDGKLSRRLTRSGRKIGWPLIATLYDSGKSRVAKTNTNSQSGWMRCWCKTPQAFLRQGNNGAERRLVPVRVSWTKKIPEKRLDWWSTNKAHFLVTETSMPDTEGFKLQHPFGQGFKNGNNLCRFIFWKGSQFTMVWQLHFLAL